MLRAVLAVFIIGGVVAWGQAQNETSGGADKVDRAAAYYHFMLAHMYAEMAAGPGVRNREYADKAIENCKAALKADPQTPLSCAELSRIYTRRPAPVRLIPPPPATPR